jgi:hypothetical protein
MANTNGNGDTSNNKHGNTFDLCKPMGEVEGKMKWDRMGTLFIRANGTGGVVYLKQKDGAQVELAVFARKRSAQKEAAPAVAA